MDSWFRRVQFQAVRLCRTGGIAGPRHQYVIVLKRKERRTKDGSAVRYTITLINIVFAVDDPVSCNPIIRILHFHNHHSREVMCLPISAYFKFHFPNLPTYLPTYLHVISCFRRKVDNILRSSEVLLSV
jgi:hypothetical protein